MTADAHLARLQAALALLHPLGPARTADPVLAVVRNPDALYAAVTEASRAARAGGVGLLLPARRVRAKAARALRAEGLHVGAFLALPSAADPALVVPLAAGPLRFALAQSGALPAWAARAGAALTPHRPLRAALAQAWPDVVLAAWAEGSSPFGWLLRHAPPGPHAVALRPGWRGVDAPVVLHAMPSASGGPGLIAKVGPGEAAARRIAREREALESLRAHAVAAGARVPTVLGTEGPPARPALVTTALAGIPAAVSLARHPARLPDVLDALAGWLGRWHAATLERHVVSDGDLDRWIRAPLARLAHAGGGLPPLVAEAMEARSDALRGTTIPLVAAHHDLTMRNVLFDDAVGSPGVVDWEEAAPTALPLGDLFYAAADAVIAAHGGTRAEAVRACFARDGRLARLVSEPLARSAAALALSPAARRLAFDACWLGHATNEAEVTRTDQPRPFFDALAAIAAPEARLWIDDVP